MTYVGLKKIGFTRTKTLGYGGDCCDFHFYKNRGKTIHLSKMIGRDGKALQQGSTYHSDKGDIRRIKRQAREDKKNK